MACGWYSLGCKGFHGTSYIGDCTNNTWISVHDDTGVDNDEAEVDEVPHDAFTSYIQSLYFTVTLLTATG